MSFLAAIVTHGTSGFSRPVQRRLIVANVTGYLATLSSLNFALTYALFNLTELKTLVIGNLVSAMITVATPWYHRFGETVAGIILAVVIYASLFYFLSVLGRDSGIHLTYIGAAVVAIVIFGLKRPVHVGVAIIVAVGLNVGAQLLFVEGSAGPVLTDEFLNRIYVSTAISLMAIVCVIVAYALTLTARAEERNEKLLKVVLPVSVAEQLMERPDARVACDHENVSVLFADLANFTPLARTMSAAQVVDLLNSLFTAFDEVGNRIGTEKIKTIGDAYMAVSGAPEADADHAASIARLALGFRQAALRLSAEKGIALELRIGIASGPVTGGVIGQSKFAYDIWGETVNLAARMESHGVVGRIQVSRSFMESLADRFRFTRRGEVDIKGIGDVETWFLESEG